MKLFKTTGSILYLFILMLSINSCDIRESNIEHTSDDDDKIVNFDFFIEGEIDGELLCYRQINYEWTNISNKYFKDYQETWLQAYNDSLDYEGAWRIRIHDMNIETIDLPYTLKESEGSVRWYDSRVDMIIKNTEFCQGIDNGCTFFLRPDRGEITITQVADQIIEGTFEGRAILVRTGFTPGQDENLYHDIENGSFRIKYRVE